MENHVWKYIVQLFAAFSKKETVKFLPFYWPCLLDLIPCCSCCQILLATWYNTWLLDLSARRISFPGRGLNFKYVDYQTLAYQSHSSYAWWTLCALFSFPGAAQLSIACSTETRESLVSFLTWAWCNQKMAKSAELTGCVSCIFQLTTCSTHGVQDSRLTPFLPSFLSWRHSHEKRYQGPSPTYHTESDGKFGRAWV